MSTFDLSSLSKQLQGGRKNTPSRSAKTIPAASSVGTAPASNISAALMHMQSLSANPRTSASSSARRPATVPTVPKPTPAFGNVDVSKGGVERAKVVGSELRQLQQDVSNIMDRLERMELEMHTISKNVSCLPDIANDVAQMLTSVQNRPSLVEYEQQDDIDTLAQQNWDLANEMVDELEKSESEYDDEEMDENNEGF